jgi:hypothetical protein
VTKKPTKTREELSALVMEQLRIFPQCRPVTGVVIAPVLRPDGRHPNWHAAFTMAGRREVPHTAWRIGSKIAAEYDLATSDQESGNDHRQIG